MAEKTLVIVESPTKAKTISRFLGKDFVIKASMGHIRDLPHSAKEIPAAVKQHAWAKLGVNIEQDFEPLYIIPPKKKENVKALKDALKNATILLLATDEDREGESISWHLQETLKPKIPVKRLVFHEITKEAIDAAIAHPREIDFNLVRAQETRRIIDRLFGYEVSPVLWKKMAPGLSAGRVQSVAVRLLVQRERERSKFVRATFWGIKGNFSTGKTETGSPFEAELTVIDEKKLASGKDFDPKTGKLVHTDRVVALSEVDAKSLREKLEKQPVIVSAVEEKPWVNSPSAPFVTSTLQQEANRKLRFSAKHTMSIAQQLYENGFITYMRTDSTTLSEEALKGARTLIEESYGKDFLPDTPRTYQTKVKNAQEAHEAIRPAGQSFTPPELVRGQLGEDGFRLYDLIWKRTVASQMKDAKGTHITVELSCDNVTFRATGKTIVFPGFLRAYVEGSDDPDAELADREKVLPSLQKGQKLETVALEATEHSTQPPPRFTEGSLIKELERLGIGRPSTWATIVEVVLARSYAFKKGTALVPTFLALAIVELLEKHFTLLLDYDFTARLEDDLDSISRGEAEGLQYLRTFYFGNGHPGLKVLVEKGVQDIDPREVCGVKIGKDETGLEYEVRIGRFGPFLSDGTRRASVPENVAPDELTVEAAKNLLETAAKGPESLGLHPEHGLPVYLRVGRFGPYIQLGDTPDESKEKPKRASLLRGMTPENITLDIAVALLSLPRTLGKSETGEDIVATNGRFGPYIQAGSETRSIPADIGVLEITLEQALELLKQPKGKRSAAKPTALRELGKHPRNETVLQVMSGRYGPYVTDGTINASLPRGMTPEAITIDEAVSLLEARAAKIAEEGPKPKRRGRKSSS